MPISQERILEFLSGNLVGFNADLRSADWDGIIKTADGASVAMRKLDEHLIALVRKHIKLKGVSIKRLKRPSLSPLTIDSLRKREGAFRVCEKTRNPDDRKGYDELNRCYGWEFSRLLEEARCGANPQKRWIILATNFSAISSIEAF